MQSNAPALVRAEHRNKWYQSVWFNALWTLLVPTAFFVAMEWLHRGTLLEWRIYEGNFDIAQRGIAMAEILLRGWGKYE